MRIGMIHYSFAPVIGGVETVMLAHAGLFAAAGHAVTVCCAEGDAPPGGDRADSSAGSIRVERFPELSAGADCARVPESTEAVALLKEKLRPILRERDVVIMHNVLTMPFHLPLTVALWELADELPSTRFISWVHDVAAANPDYQLPSPSLSPWELLRRAHPRIRYVAVSELRKEQFLAVTGAPERCCSVAPNGIDPWEHLQLSPSVRRFAQSAGLLERELVLLHPTRLLRRKNVELSIRILDALRRSGCDAALVVTGASDPHNAKSAEYAASVRALRAELGLEPHALFAGDEFSVGIEDVPGLYRLADALLFPSRQEGFGLPVLEAAVHRLPVFCSDITPLNSLLHYGITAFAIEDPPSKIAGKIMQQLSASPAIQARKEAVRAYAWPAIYRNFLAPLLDEAQQCLHP